MRKALVTVAIGDYFRKMARISYPGMLKYAMRTGAEMLVFTDPVYDQHQFDKMRACAEALKRFDRILYMDVDCLIHEECPDLFELVPQDRLGAMDEGRHATDEQRSVHAGLMRTAAVAYGMEETSEFHNTGVLVASRQHASAFHVPKVVEMPYGEQPLFNLNCAANGIQLHDIGPDFNRMPYHGRLSLGEPWIRHYAGMTDALQKMRTDLPVHTRPNLLTPSDREAVPEVLGLGGASCVEVGSYAGEFAARILEQGPSDLWLVDPWEVQDLETWPDDHARKANLDGMFYEVLKRFSGDDRVHVLRTRSLDACSAFRDGSLDFVYVDAVHTLEGVLTDCTAWWPKLRRGGWLCGHDYTGRFPGVKMAVDAFCRTVRADLGLLTTEAAWASWGVRRT